MLSNFITKFSRTKKIIAVFLITSFVFSSSVSYAVSDDKSVGNKVYSFVVDHYAAPFTGTVAGWVVCGPVCSAIGGSLGAIDEALKHYGYTDRDYLTWGVIGAMIGGEMYIGAIKLPDPASIKYMDVVPSYDDMITDFLRVYCFSGVGVGAVVGVLLVDGKLHQHTELVAPAISAVAGNSISGALGMPGASGLVAGGALGAADELSIYKGRTDKHYATCAVTSAALANIFVSLLPVKNSYLKGAVGVVLFFVGSIASSYYENDIIEKTVLPPIKTARQAYEVYNQYLPKNYVDSCLEKQALAYIGIKFLTIILILEFNKHTQVVRDNFGDLKKPDEKIKAWNNLIGGSINVAILLIPYALNNIVLFVLDNHMVNYLSRDLQFALEDQIKSQLFSKENLLRLSEHDNSTDLINSLRSDVSSAVNYGNGLMTSTLSSFMDGADGFSKIADVSPNIFIYAVISSSAKSFFNSYMQSGVKEATDEINRLNSRRNSFVGYDHKNIMAIMEKKEDIWQIDAKLRESENKMHFHTSMISAFEWVVAIVDVVLADYLLVGCELMHSRLKTEDVTKLQTAKTQLVNLLSWSSESAKKIANADPSLGRIVILTNWMQPNDTCSPDDF